MTGRLSIRKTTADEPHISTGLLNPRGSKPYIPDGFQGRIQRHVCMVISSHGVQGRHNGSLGMPVPSSRESAARSFSTHWFHIWPADKE